VLGGPGSCQYIPFGKGVWMRAVLAWQKGGWEGGGRNPGKNLEAIRAVTEMVNGIDGGDGAAGVPAVDGGDGV
jgi:hypothetical protein